jgi:hypothetical protein
MDAQQLREFAAGLRTHCTGQARVAAAPLYELEQQVQALSAEQPRQLRPAQSRRIVDK